MSSPSIENGPEILQCVVSRSSEEQSNDVISQGKTETNSDKQCTVDVNVDISSDGIQVGLPYCTKGFNDAFQSSFKSSCSNETDFTRISGSTANDCIGNNNTGNNIRAAMANDYKSNPVDNYSHAQTFRQLDYESVPVAVPFREIPYKELPLPLHGENFAITINESNDLRYSKCGSQVNSKVDINSDCNDNKQNFTKSGNNLDDHEEKGRIFSLRKICPIFFPSSLIQKVPSLNSQTDSNISNIQKRDKSSTNQKPQKVKKRISVNSKNNSSAIGTILDRWWDLMSETFGTVLSFLLVFIWVTVIVFTIEYLVFSVYDLASEKSDLGFTDIDYRYTSEGFEEIQVDYYHENGGAKDFSMKEKYWDQDQLEDNELNKSGSIHVGAEFNNDNEQERPERTENKEKELIIKIPSKSFNEKVFNQKLRQLYQKAGDILKVDKVGEQVTEFTNLIESYTEYLTNSARAVLTANNKESNDVTEGCALQYC